MANSNWAFFARISLGSAGKLNVNVMVTTGEGVVMIGIVVLNTGFGMHSPASFAPVPLVVKPVAQEEQSELPMNSE